jgi:hypothetical protein
MYRNRVSLYSNPNPTRIEEMGQVIRAPFVYS